MPASASYRRQVRTFITALFLIQIIGFSLLTYAQHNQVSSNCRAIEELKLNSYKQYTRALKTTPTLAYYKSHPKELAKALQQIKAGRKDFAAKPCP